MPFVLSEQQKFWAHPDSIREAQEDFEVWERARDAAFSAAYRRSGTTPAGSIRGWPYDR